LRQGLYLRHGCKNGGCGTCKAKLLDGDVTAPPGALALSSDEEADGWVLLCSSSASEDCTLDLSNMDLSEEELLEGDQAREYVAQVECNEPLTRNLRRLRLRLVEPASLPFTAGQFINVMIAGTDEVRSFSLANSPNDAAHAELIVKMHPGGAFSGLLEDKVSPGSEVRFRGPYGQLRVRLSHRPMVMIAGGAGLAPLLSMLAVLADEENTRPVQLYFGARTPADLYWLNRVHQLQTAMPVLEFVPVVEQEWPGEMGLVTEVLARRMPSLDGFDAYMAGPPALIETAVPLLLERGVRRRNLHFDAFLPTGR
jgi:propane monooxygenase reductase subunit